MEITESKEIVWLPASLAKKVKDVTNVKYLEDEILKYVEQTKGSLKTDIESIDDDIIQYRAYMIKAKNAFKEAKDEQLSASYEMWENFDKELAGIRQYVSKAKDEISPLKQELEDVKRLMGEVDKYGIKDLLSLINEINSSYRGETANIIKFLFDNYKKNKEA